MIEEKDASTPSDERHVNKQISNVNLSTQKKTGGKRIMGNQGMTNWKVTTFLAIALILVAGTFSTAIAEKGDGSVIAAWAVDETVPDDDKTAVGDPNITEAPLPAASKENGLEFTYTVPNIDMTGGSVKIVIPSDWRGKISKKLVQVTDGVVIYETDSTEITDDDPDDATTRPRRGDVTILPKSGEWVHSIQVKLGGTGRWGEENNSELIIRFGLVEAPNPSTLPDTALVSGTNRHLRAYKFPSSSSKDSKTFRELVPKGIDGGDTTQPQPYVRVGNVVSGIGDVTVSPETVYEMEPSYNLRLDYTALGPMYNSRIQVTIPASLIPNGEATEGQAEETAYLVANTTVSIGGSTDLGRVSAINNRSFTVVSGANDGNGTVTIYIDSMRKGDSVRVFYKSGVVEAPVLGDNANMWRVQTDSDEDSAITDDYAPTDGIYKGEVKAQLGSGKVTTTPSSVEVGSPRNFTITYTAATKLENVYLWVELPTRSASPVHALEGATAATALTLTEDTVDSENENNSSYGYINQTRITGDVKQVLADSRSAVVWGPLDFSRGNTFTKTIERTRVGDNAGSFDWIVHLLTGDDPITDRGTLSDGDVSSATTPGTPSLLSEAATLYVLEASADPNSPSVMFDLTNSYAEGTLDTAQDDSKFFQAAEKYRVVFTFSATNTPIKDGYVEFTLPSGWTPPTTGDAAGQVTVQTDTDDRTGDEVMLDKKYVSTPSQRIRVDIKDAAGDGVTVPRGGRIIITYGAQADLATAAPIAGKSEIRGYYKAGTAVTRRVAGQGFDITIQNVGPGSGLATIDNIEVDAGSTDNNFTIRFTAQGSMNGGRVVLVRPANWGDLQGTDAAGANYGNVQASSGGTLRDKAVGVDRVVANLDTFTHNSVLTFTLRKLEAQPSLGIASFTLYSAGSASQALELVKGEKESADTVDTEAERVLEKKIVLATDANGRLRVQVGGGGDGSGTVGVDIIGSREGPGTYDEVDDDGKPVEVVVERVHAGDDGSTYLLFTYTPVETIADGKLEFTTPAGWSPPQVDSTREPGFVRLDPTNGSLGSPVFNGSTMTFDIYSLDKSSSGNIKIHYGEGDGGAVPPTTMQTTSTFRFRIQGGSSDAGSSLQGIAKQPPVRVRPQASGRGDVSINTGGDVHAGNTGQEVTITYTSIGQVVGGKLKVTVPADWSDAMAANFSVSTGTPAYGGGMTMAQREANDDFTDGDDGMDELVVSGINLSGAGRTLTITYTTDIQPTAADDIPFKFAFDGSHGPDKDLKPLADQTVEVMGAADGSGTASRDQGGEIVAGSTGNDLVFTYIAQGEIGAGRAITVEVPDGWSPPSTTADAEGNITVLHEEADEDADDGYTEVKDRVAVSVTGSVTDSVTGSVTEDMEIVVTVAAEETVAQNDRITITYSNATAPAAPEKSAFKVFLGDTAVGDPLNVLVQSAEGASAVSLSSDSDSFIIDDGGTLTVTVKLVAADGSAATQNAATTVTLSADGGTIASSVTIDAGSYHADASLSADEPGSITITAAATGLEGAELMVTANTDNVMIDSVTVTPPVATVGSSVTVSATATAAQTAMFSVTNADGVGVQPSTMTEDESGSYTGTFMVVVDQHPDGVYDVTVSINSTSMTSEGALTIDSTAPTVSASASAEMVANGDTVTISAMAADDGSGVVSVMADVSMLDSTQGMVELMMGDDGSYSADVMISEDNEAMNGEHTITVTAEDMAGNSAMSEPVMVTLQNEISYTSTIPAGISLFHVPLDVEGLDTVGDLETMIGDTVLLLITYDGTIWNSRSSDMAITADLGILVSLSAETMVTFTGNAWGAGDSMINLSAGSNLVGVPVNDDRVTDISDIIDLFDEGVVSNIIVSSGGEFQLVAAAGDAADGPVAGDAAYLVIASAAGSAMVSGAGWMNGEMAGAAPIALSGYTVDNQTPVLDVHGSVVDEITGLIKEGFRVKVKNLATKAALSNVTSVEAADGYNITFVDLADSYAARVGDVLEITVDSPDPLVGVRPVRHTVTVDDVKNSLIELESLIAYEIPAETELLRNYPNPFNPETWIPYRLAEDADVSLTIYDAYGSLVRSVDIGHQIAAVYDTRAKAIYWDGRNQFGEQVASGLYFYHLSAGDFSGTRRMVILK